ncbi:Uncharacterised protein [Candidatus Tiddalikarchaeum anstoanum]|nr:Uncharacterised protein [Candidatus Tiddalikarchaeum anstoanum]
MTIEELITKKSLPEILKNLQNIEFELKYLTSNIDKVINPNRVKTRDELFQQFKNLRIETENLLSEVEGKQRLDVEIIKRVANRVKEIMAEKKLLEEELRMSQEAPKTQ